MDALSAPGRRRELSAALCMLLGVALVYLLITASFGLSLTAHSPLDSYTLQAMAWRDGRVTVNGPDYTWLELAVYGGEYFISFPPFPSVAMLPLTFIFGGETPSLLVNLVLLLGGAAFGYGLLRRLGHAPERAAALGFAYVCGCNLLVIMMDGGVWYIAQGMAFLLTTASLFAMQSPRGARDRAAMLLGPLCVALAVGCRPFQAIYVPWVLYRLYTWRREAGEAPRRAVAGMIPYLIAPALVAVAYGWYNWLRFGDPLEFGHNYLPEFSSEGGVQFSLAHWPANVQNILRLPHFEEGRLRVYTHFGVAFYLFNPLYVVSTVRTICRAVRRKLDRADALLVALIFIHFNALLLHRTLGGLQFGTRYLIDPLPAVLLLTWRKDDAPTPWDALALLLGVAFNVYGAILFINY